MAGSLLKRLSTYLLAASMAVSSPSAIAQDSTPKKERGLIETILEKKTSCAIPSSKLTISPKYLDQPKAVLAVHGVASNRDVWATEMNKTIAEKVDAQKYYFGTLDWSEGANLFCDVTAGLAGVEDRFAKTAAIANVVGERAGEQLSREIKKEDLEFILLTHSNGAQVGARLIKTINREHPNWKIKWISFDPYIPPIISDDFEVGEKVKIVNLYTANDLPCTGEMPGKTVKNINLTETKKIRGHSSPMEYFETEVKEGTVFARRFFEFKESLEEQEERIKTENAQRSASENSSFLDNITLSAGEIPLGYSLTTDEKILREFHLRTNPGTVEYPEFEGEKEGIIVYDNKTPSRSDHFAVDWIKNIPQKDKGNIFKYISGLRNLTSQDYFSTFAVYETGNDLIIISIYGDNYPDQTLEERRSIRKSLKEFSARKKLTEEWTHPFIATDKNLEDLPKPSNSYQVVP